MIYFMRHGLDDERFIGGHSDVSLVLEGVLQVREASLFMINNGFNFQHIYSSDITRAIETSCIVKEYYNLPIRLKPCLRELDKGDVTGMLVTEALDKYQWLRNVNVDTKYPGGESLLDFYKRIKKDLEEILSFENSLVVTHRGVINMLYFILNDISVSNDKGRFSVSHASIHEYDKDKNRIRKIF